MQITQLYLCVLTGFLLNSSAECSISSLWDSITTLNCKWRECCDKRWTHSDFKVLEDQLKANVFGQDIAIEVVLGALEGHLNRENPKTKALTLSFHGRQGIGKNHISNIIKKSLFSLGEKSEYAVFFTALDHFPLKDKVEEYKMKINEKIKEAVSRCEYALIIFDEVHFMPPGVLDAVKPFIDYHDNIDGVDYRRSIFIFISNTGGNDITDKYLKLRQDGRKREDLRLENFENMVKTKAYNDEGGFLFCEAIDGDLIDHYVPFLPLEEIHVRQCIRNEFLIRKFVPTPEDVNEVIKFAVFGPDDNPILSKSGCKRFPSKVMQRIARSHSRHPRQDL